MGALGQPVEGRHPRLRHPAARAQNVPAQVEEPRLDRLQAQLDRLALAHPPVPGELERPDMPEIDRSEEHTSELQSLMRTSYAVFCLKQKIQQKNTTDTDHKTTKSTTT